MSSRNTSGHSRVHDMLVRSIESRKRDEWTGELASLLSIRVAGE